LGNVSKSLKEKAIGKTGSRTSKKKPTKQRSISRERSEDVFNGEDASDANNDDTLASDATTSKKRLLRSQTRATTVDQLEDDDDQMEQDDDPRNPPTSPDQREPTSRKRAREISVESDDHSQQETDSPEVRLIKFKLNELKAQEKRARMTEELLQKLADAEGRNKKKRVSTGHVEKKKASNTQRKSCSRKVENVS